MSKLSDDVSDILNSPFVNKLIQLAMTKSGAVAAALASWLTAWLLAHAGLSTLIVKYSGIASLLGVTLTVDQVHNWIEYGAVAILAWFLGWVIQRQRDGVKLMQSAINLSDTPAQIKVDGFAGNNTVAAQLQATNVDPHAAKADVLSAHEAAGDY